MACSPRYSLHTELQSRNMRTQHRHTTNIAPSQFVFMANYTASSSLTGSLLMATSVFDGVRGPLNIEGCWWLLDSQESTLHPGANNSDLKGPLLLGTGECLHVPLPKHIAKLPSRRVLRTLTTRPRGLLRECIRPVVDFAAVPK